MKFLVKKLNKFNGNICCSLENEAGQYYVAECNRYNGTIAYAMSANQVIDICSENPDDYLITYGTQDIYKYSSGTLNLYLSVGRTIDLIEDGEAKEYYGFDKTTRTLFKFHIGFSLLWEITIDSSGDQDDSKIQYRESDRTIIYNDSDRITVVRDDITSAVVISSLDISGTGPLQVVSYNIDSPSVLRFKYRSVDGKELDQSSSSST